MLTLTLRQLEREGLVDRTVYTVVPSRVDHELTPLGATLLETITSLVAWAEAHHEEIAKARFAYDERARRAADQ
jgi:DNA-binding HxlR family transcriptional regulator